MGVPSVLEREDRDWLQQRAVAAGFSLCGVAAVLEDGEEDDERLAAWIAAGHAGEMDYLKRTDGSGKLIRGDLRRSTPWARSVIVCAANYNAPGTPLSIAPAPPGAGWIARYAWSGSGDNAPADYHDLLLPRLRLMEQELLLRFGPGLRTRCYVDTGPLLERGYAARAGIGWIGKNTCVLHQQQGSWLLLGVIVSSLELSPAAWAVPAADRCGSCTRCIDACPTSALLTPATPTAPRAMDASRCIAYLTIEKSGTIAEELRAPMGRHVFGCDICQDVCPWNERAQRGPVEPLSPVRRELINPALDWLASLEGPAFTQVFRRSPIERTRRETSRRKRFRRNLAIAMGNSGEARFVPQLEAWSDAADPALADAANWALTRIRTRG